METIMKRYSVTFNTPEYNAEYSLSREKSSAFKYGNGTCVCFSCNGKTLSVFDTRYDPLVMEDFDAWCCDFLMNYFNPDLEPIITEVTS